MTWWCGWDNVRGDDGRTVNAVDTAVAVGWWWSWKGDDTGGCCCCDDDDDDISFLLSSSWSDKNQNFNFCLVDGAGTGGSSLFVVVMAVIEWRLSFVAVVVFRFKLCWVVVPWIIWFIGYFISSTSYSSSSSSSSLYSSTTSTTNGRWVVELEFTSFKDDDMVNLYCSCIWKVCVWMRIYSSNDINMYLYNNIWCIYSTGTTSSI